MIGMLLSIALFACWMALGYALVSSLRSQRNVLQNLLLAPVVGMSAILLPVFALNRAGMPTSWFAAILSAVLLLGAVALFRRFRPPFPARRYLPFAAILFAALIAAGWPILLHGFDWVSYANSDMAAVSFAAQYFLNHGFLDGPDARDMAAGLDYSQYLWFLYAVTMHRVGNEMLLSWAAGLTHLRPDQVYMSLTLALHLALISVTGALVLQNRRLRLAALLACGLLALSALGTQAVMNQLSSQVGGLALLAGSATLLLHPYGEMGWRRLGRIALLVAILLAAMLLYYPEMLPFLGVSFVLYALVGGPGARRTMRMAWVVAAFGGVLSLVVLNKQAVAAFVHLFSAASAGASAQGILEDGFPHFLKPSGLAILWGFQVFNAIPPEPWGSITVIAGAVTLLLAAAAIVALTFLRRVPVAVVALVILAVAFTLFIRRGDFGLFKTAFFIQPFLLASVVVATFTFARTRIARVAPIVVLGLAGCAAQHYYTEKSADLAGSSGEIWNGSSLRVKSQFDALLASVPKDRILVVDTPNFVLAELQALIARTRPILFTFDMADALAFKPTAQSLDFQRVLNPGIVATNDRARGLMDEQRSATYPRARFELNDSRDPSSGDSFAATRLPSGADAVLVSTTRAQSLFNRRGASAPGERSYSLRPFREVSNHLAFLPSTLGPYYMSFQPTASFYQLEADPFFAGQTMAGVGRHLLFQAINPSPGARLVMEVTASLKGDGENRLPQADAIGERRAPFPLLGRGSARVFSPSLVPQRINASPYLAIDMNTDGVRFPSRETGLMKLYGADRPLDRRRLVAFARDISLVSEDDYRRLTPPAGIGSFPAGLADPALEYSGVYEDGWIGERAFLTLGQRADSRVLRVKGTIPRILDPKFTSAISVLVDGRLVSSRELGVGEFEVAVPLAPARGNRRIDLQFTKYQRLPGGDNRPVSALLSYVGFAAADPKT